MDNDYMRWGPGESGTNKLEIKVAGWYQQVLGVYFTDELDGFCEFKVDNGMGLQGAWQGAIHSKEWSTLVPVYLVGEVDYEMTLRLYGTHLNADATVNYIEWLFTPMFDSPLFPARFEGD